MKDLVTKLLAIWHNCLIDHHKDRDCHFYIQQKFCTYGGERWVVYHNGYLYQWELEWDSYEKCIASLGVQLTEMIEQECTSYLEQRQAFSNEQIQTIEDNLKELRELLDNAEA